jgi:hypothetical protein
VRLFTSGASNNVLLESLQEKGGCRLLQRGLLSQKLGKPDFKSSRGWFFKSRNRQGRIICGECLSADDESVQPFPARVMWASHTKISLKKKLHNKPKRRVQARRRKMRGLVTSPKYVQIFRSETKLGLHGQFVDSNPLYRTYYLILREMRQDVLKGQ